MTAPTHRPPGSTSPESQPAGGTVRVGCVRYLNTVPLVEGLEKVRGFELDAAVPARLIDMLVGHSDRSPADELGPRVDIALISVIDAAASPVPLTLIPAGMIGCDGPTLTVRLFSRVPFEQTRQLHADTDSHTSVALARVLLDRVFDVRPEVVPFDARERVAFDTGKGSPAGEDDHGDWPETMLLIGDKVVTDSPPAIRYPHQLDLGEAWKDHTGLPFAYAVWACRRDDRDRPAVRTAAAVLDRQRRRNAARLDWIVARRSGALRWPLDLARRYFGELLRFEITPEVRTAAQRFVDAAADLGLVPPTRLEWHDGFDRAGGSDAAAPPRAPGEA